MSPQRKELEKHLKEMCQGMGFKKMKYKYQKQINDNFCANIMFPCASYQIKYHILVGCSVGITSIQIQSIFEQCSELVNDKEHGNTILTNLGYITPQNHYMEWDYSKQSDPSIFFCEIQKEIERIGATIPFQRQLRLNPIGLVDRYNGTFTQNYNLTMSQYYLGFGYRF